MPSPSPLEETLLAALKGVERLFENPSAFYIQKLVVPITSTDREMIDRVFINAYAAIAEAERVRADAGQTKEQ